MGRQVLSSCHPETKTQQWRPWPVGRRIHLPLYSDQRLQVIDKGHCWILQSAWRQGTYLWRHEQRIRLEQAPQVIHGGEYCLSSAYCIDTQFLQDHHEQAWHQGFWAQENESHKGFCLQIHLRTCQVDHDCKAIRAEYLHREPSLCKTLQNRIRIRILSFRFESAYYLKSHRGVRGWWLHIDVVLLLFTESCY